MKSREVILSWKIEFIHGKENINFLISLFIIAKGSILFLGITAYMEWLKLDDLVRQ